MKRTYKVSPKKIGLRTWSKQFEKISTETISRYRYYNNGEWGIYLSPPATFMVYGMRELKRLKFDNSFEALRMWGFVFNETERLFRAKQIGKKVIATMGDLGVVPILVMSFPECVPFYPECLWWTPFFKESTELLDTASKLGVPEATCFSRAVVAAFHKKAYFPKPDLIIASTGASCDDYSCVMQTVEDMGYEVFWAEIPYRKSPEFFLNKPKPQILEKTKEGFVYPKILEEHLIREYKRIWQALFKLTGVNNPHRLVDTIKKINTLRRLVMGIKRMNEEAPIAPIPALELMVIEFGNLYGYADFDEWLEIVEMIYHLVKDRVAKGIGVLKKDAIPIAWVTPSADPYLLNLVEECGCRVVTTEYVINQALVQIEEDIEPLRALARAFINASLIGSTEERIKKIKEKIVKKQVKGVLITNMLGASHCAMETRLIEKLLSDVPILSIDVPAPFGITQQIKTRLEAFVEAMR
ncbi:MAG: 2-hydroxyacyl-CoA dehydratase family protein [candidate division WOR-3 bacterium]|nr:2-hydroxyacyl-CoA dehydratase family protein [candidate division WOR-3 bacterium]